MPDPYWIGAQICAVIANVNRAKGPAARVEDFIPRVESGRRPTAEEQVAAFRAATDHLGK